MARPKYNGRYSKTMTDALRIARLVAPNVRIHKNIRMSDFATFKTGGNASLFLEIFDIIDLYFLLEQYSRHNIDFIVLGKGSNILVSDSGIDMPVLIPSFNDIQLFCLKDSRLIYADAGCSLKSIANYAAQNNLSGFEFAAGIPGSLGGGIIMNAGAYGGELKDCIVSVQVWNAQDGIKFVDAADADFGYRYSAFSEKDDVVLGAFIKLNEGKREDIYSLMSELAKKRRFKQPLDLPSAGSTFKRPKGNYAGALIEQCGLKGLKIGGAQVSEKHCGFIVNTGGATSGDVYVLINYVIKTVREKTGIELEPEVKFIGDFSYCEL